MNKLYDQAYFDHWYRDPDRHEEIQQRLEHKVALAVAMAEYHLGYVPETVLDVGCGEGPWRHELLKLAPEIDYMGLDSSEYVVERYGQERNIHCVSFDQLADLQLDQKVDLLICSDVMHYVAEQELLNGLAGFSQLCDGLAWLEVFCSEDAVEGDHAGFYRRSADWYRTHFKRAGFLECGSYCYLSAERRDDAMALEIYQW